MKKILEASRLFIIIFVIVIVLIITGRPEIMGIIRTDENVPSPGRMSIIIAGLAYIAFCARALLFKTERRKT
jgi:hypothetical protein